MRRIDSKYHIDGDQIIKTSNREVITTDEPTFIFRGRDVYARAVLHHYLKICVEGGCTDFHVAGIEQMIAAFEEFAAVHPERMKQPGITRGQ